MQTLITTIGKSKSFWAAAALVVLVSAAGRMAFASEMTPQQKAAADILVQQKVLDENRAAYDAFNAASTQLQNDEDCIHNVNACSFLDEKAPAR